MPRFTAIPEVPLGGMSDWMFALLSSMKENIELLTGTRGAQDRNETALTPANITTAPAPAPTMTGLTANGAGYTISGAQVPTLTDHLALMNDVQRLANDVSALRTTVNSLIANMKG